MIFFWSSRNVDSKKDTTYLHPLSVRGYGYAICGSSDVDGLSSKARRLTRNYRGQSLKKITVDLAGKDVL